MKLRSALSYLSEVRCYFAISAFWAAVVALVAQPISDRWQSRLRSAPEVEVEAAVEAGAAVEVGAIWDRPLIFSFACRNPKVPMHISAATNEPNEAIWHSITHLFAHGSSKDVLCLV